MTRYRRARAPITNSDEEGGRAEPVSGGGRIEHAAWLSTDLLALVGSVDTADNGPFEGSVRLGGRTVPIVAESISCAADVSDAPNGRSARLILARTSSGEPASEDMSDLVIKAGDRTISFEPSDLRDGLTDLHGLLRGALVSLDPATRTRVTQFVASCAAPDAAHRERVKLSKSLNAVRDALRERLPRNVIAKGERLGLHVESLFQVDQHCYYMRGWIWDPEGEVSRLTVVTPEGSRMELSERLFRYPRPDVQQAYTETALTPDRKDQGFIVYFETDVPSYLSNGWLVEIGTPWDPGLEAQVPPPVSDLEAVKNNVLGDVARERYMEQDLLPHHVMPAMNRLMERHAREVGIEHVIEYGIPPADPVASIVVPLYRRIDFLEQQLAQFVHDPEIREADLVYVLDSPELTQPLLETAARLFPLYRIPFRIAVMTRNSGFAHANNAGVSLSRARKIVLLNSDALPARRGWLGAMASFYDATPGIGALGPKLLYEDDSIQHAGLYFHWEPYSHVWNTETYFKGLHGLLPAANVTRPVPGVTAACMMIDRELYERIGGLRGMYVQGDFEDSDRCLRLAEAGYRKG